MKGNYEFNPEFYKFLYNFYDMEMSAQELLEIIFYDYDEKTRAEIIEECMWSVLSFERAKSYTLNDDKLYEAFSEELQNPDRHIPYHYPYQPVFKLKCILTAFAIKGECSETIPEATYKFCGNKDYPILEESLFYGIKVDNESELLSAISDLIIFVASIPTGIFCIPVMILCAIRQYHRATTTNTKGLRKSYRKIKKAMGLKEKKTYTADDSDRWDECFYSTYVNM